MPTELGIQTSDLQSPPPQAREPKRPDREFVRFTRLQRALHACMIISFISLATTGLTLKFSYTPWAATVSRLLGGFQTAGFIHRAAAVLMFGVFCTHIYDLVQHKKRENKSWLALVFGPDSMLFNRQDLHQFLATMKWFLGRGERPQYGRWTYWEKFDYWAVFWGMAIIGGSGLTLWLPNVTASFLPGWAFNVATLIHGEEAILAAVFLFTVHFFNNHFRPDKHPPPDIVMFTGTVPLEEFRREHTLEYARLVESGELEKHLVDAPSRPMTLGSRILGITLIICGLTLLVLVLIGFVGSMGGG